MFFSQLPFPFLFQFLVKDVTMLNSALTTILIVIIFLCWIIVKTAENFTKIQIHKCDKYPHICMIIFKWEHNVKLLDQKVTDYCLQKTDNLILTKYLNPTFSIVHCSIYRKSGKIMTEIVVYSVQLVVAALFI